MGNEYIILEGKDYDRLVAEGMQRLNAKKEDLQIEVLESKKNLFSSYYKLKISNNNAASLEAIESSIDSILTGNRKEREKSIEFSFREDGVYLKISSDVTMSEIITRTDLKRIQGLELSEVKKLLEEKNYDKWARIAEAQEELKINSECKVKLSKDNMKAYITITRPIGGEDITENAIREALAENNVVFNIKDDEIAKAVSDRIYEKEILIAEGVEPKDGEDARIEYHFDTSAPKPANIDKDGKIDYHELSLIQNVNKGQKLVTLIPHTPGIPGKNVLGADVPGRDGKKLVLPKGKNVEPSPDGLELLAAVDGEVKLLDGKVSVFSVYEVKQNVDNSTGNIRFNGKVVVMGNVLTGFVIEAEGDVEVYGVVEGALIKSNGNIILHRGIQGMNRGELYCEGDLIAKFIENCKIEARGSIKSDAVMHSQVTCGRKLEASGRKGLLVGGSFKVGEEIKAKVIGSPMATVTELEVGVNPDLRKKYDDVKNELKQVSENLDKTTKAVDLLTKMSKTTELPMDKRLLLSKSVKLKLQLQQRLEQVKSEQAEMEAYFEELSKGKIKVSDVIYPGCRIIIGSSLMHIKDTVKYAAFYRANAEIKIGSYDDV